MILFPNATFEPQHLMGGYIKNVYGLAHLNAAHVYIGRYLFVDVEFDQYAKLADWCKRYSYYMSVYVQNDVGWWHLPHKETKQESEPWLNDHVLYTAFPPPKWEKPVPNLKDDAEYLIAMNGNYGIERPKGVDKSIATYKVGYIRGIVALTMVDGIKKDHTPKRASYNYVELNDNVKPVGSYFTVMATGAKIKEIGTFPASDNSTLFVLIDGKWWSFPYSSGGLKIDFTPCPEYEQKRLNEALVTVTAANVKERVAANGNVTILKDQRGDTTPWWWVSGEETRNHIEMLKGHGGRWSKKRKAWYFVTDELHADVLALAGDAVDEDTATDEVLL